MDLENVHRNCKKNKDLEKIIDYKKHKLEECSWFKENHAFEKKFMDSDFFQEFEKFMISIKVCEFLEKWN